jgi:hypothetical protein
LNKIWQLANDIKNCVMMIQEAKENKKNVQRGAQFIISFCGCVFFSRL